MTHGRTFWVTSCLMALTAFAWAQAPPSRGRQLLADKQYAQALPALEEELKASPGDRLLLAAKVDALMGLGRFKEAAEVAFPMGSRQPGMAFRAGTCLFQSGRTPQALMLWSSLRTDPEWAGPAYVQIVRALLATGREEEARTLTAEALANLPSPASDLWRWSLELDPSPDNARKALDHLLASAGGDRDRWVSFRAMVDQAAPGHLWEEGAEGALPAELAVAERADQEDSYGLLSPGPREPKGPAPSAMAYDNAEYTSLPPRVMAFSGAGLPGDPLSLKRLVIPARVNGAGASLALDPTLDVLVIGSELAKKLGLAEGTPAAFWSPGVGMRKDGRWVLVKRVQVGPVTWQNLPAIVLPEGRANAWHHAEGALPLWLLRHCGLHWDRRGNRLVLLPSGTPPDRALGSGSFLVGSAWLEGRPFAAVVPGRSDPAFFLVDTASRSTILDSGHLGTLGFSRKVERFASQVERGSFGYFPTDTVEGVTLGVGSATITMSTAKAALLNPGGSSDAAGLLGRDVLDLFDLYIDYGAGIMALKGYSKGK